MSTLAPESTDAPCQATSTDRAALRTAEFRFTLCSQPLLARLDWLRRAAFARPALHALPPASALTDSALAGQ